MIRASSRPEAGSSSRSWSAASASNSCARTGLKASAPKSQPIEEEGPGTEPSRITGAEARHK